MSYLAGNINGIWHTMLTNRTNQQFRNELVISKRGPGPTEVIEQDLTSALNDTSPQAKFIHSSSRLCPYPYHPLESRRIVLRLLDQGTGFPAQDSNVSIKHEQRKIFSSIAYMFTLFSDSLPPFAIL